MTLHHDALEHRASARASVRNHLRRNKYFLELRPQEHFGLVSGCIPRSINKAFHCYDLGKANHKFQRKFNVELHGTDNDRELMA